MWSLTSRKSLRFDKPISRDLGGYDEIYITLTNNSSPNELLL